MRPTCGRARRGLVVLAAALAMVAGVSACSGRSSRNGRGSAFTAPTSTSTTAVSAPATTAPAVAPLPPGSACSPARPQPAGQSARTIQSHGFARRYLLYVPPSYDGRTGVPVVFNFHGYGSSAQQQALYTDFGGLADRDGFLVVTPDGQGTPQHFNLIGTPAGEEDDVVFTLDLLDEVERTMCVNSRRVYTTGMSNGGAFSLVLACRASDRFAAYGPVAALVYAPQCEVAEPVSIVGFAGTADPVVPFEGGQVNCCGSPTIPGAMASMASWANHDGCAAAPRDAQLSPQVLLHRWEGCRAGSAVDFYAIVGGGHTWPGARVRIGFLGVTTSEVSATDTIWAFFRAHERTA